MVPGDQYQVSCIPGNQQVLPSPRSPPSSPSLSWRPWCQVSVPGVLYWVPGVRCQVSGVLCPAPVINVLPLRRRFPLLPSLPLVAVPPRHLAIKYYFASKQISIAILTNLVWRLLEMLTAFFSSGSTCGRLESGILPSLWGKRQVIRWSGDQVIR